MSAQDGALIGCGPHGHINCTACADAQRDQERRERAERREANLQALLHYITSEAARITGVPHEQPSDVVETIRQLYKMAESGKVLRAHHESLVAHWCKDGETLAERLQRERDDSLALMGLLAKEKQRAKDAEDRHACVIGRDLKGMVTAFLALHAEHAALLAAVRELGAAQDQWQADGTRASRELAWQKLTTLRALVAAQGPEGGER
jgi:hypothetical protein